MTSGALFARILSMLMIRLQRVGRKHDPSYRVVVTEKGRGIKSANYIEMLGSYDPRKEKKDSAVISAERVKYWIGKGAAPSITVHNILVQTGVVDGKKIAKHSKKNWKEPAKKEEIKEEVKEDVRAEVPSDALAKEES